MGQHDGDYMTYRQAAELLGIHESNVAAHVQRGNLPTRPGPRNRPSLLRSDVEQLSRDRAERAARGRARQQARAAATERAQPPDRWHEWLTAQQVAVMLGVTVQMVRRRCREGALDATQVGKKWWVRADQAHIAKANREREARC